MSGPSEQAVSNAGAQWARRVNMGFPNQSASSNAVTLGNQWDGWTYNVDLDAATGDFTLTLPAIASSVGMTLALVVSDQDATTPNDLVVSAAAGETIAATVTQGTDVGSNSLVTNALTFTATQPATGAHFFLRCDGVEWFLTGNYKREDLVGTLVSGAITAPTTADKGRLYLVNTTGNATVTLPTAVNNDGLWFRFLIAANAGTESFTITATPADSIHGMAITGGDNQTNAFPTGALSDQLALTATAGNLIGTTVNCMAANDLWFISVVTLAAAAAAVFSG